MIRLHRFLRAAAACCAALCLAALAGCVSQNTKPGPPKYEQVDKRPVPPFMRGTLYEITNLQNDNPFLVSGWGLVVNLAGTGGSDQMPNTLKAYMAKELERRGFGSKLMPGYQDISPESVLHDRNNAVVAVYGWLPPGARKGDWFDVTVKAEGEASSLARGTLYDTELTINGADPLRPTQKVNVWATSYGPVFVNPAVALHFTQNPDAATKKSLRTGTILAGGQVMADRPLLLRLRQPENRLSRNIEMRVNEYFHQDKVCTAYDLGYCQLWVPKSYNGDWEHFAKLVLHLYVNGSEAFGRAKARELIEEAEKPGAPLQDISYCLEGLGSYALPAIGPVLADSATPTDVRFAVARAAAYIDGPSEAAERVLHDIAQTPGNSFRLAAVQVLGRIPNSRRVNALLRDLLDSDQTTVRLEAYHILARNGDPAVESRVICSAREPTNQKFVLDFVHSHGDPLIYATRSGVPRIAIFGEVPQVTLPLTFGAMDNHLMISSAAVGRDVTLFYRDAQLRQPIQMSSPPGVADIVARLAGQIDDGTGQLDFTYAEVLAILQGLSDQHKLRVTRSTGEQVAAAFMIQEVPLVRDAIDAAPLLGRGRPQGGEAPRIDAPATQPQMGQAEDGAVNTAAALPRQ